VKDSSTTPARGYTNWWTLRRPLWIYLWPGLGRIWLLGDFSSLVTAFAASLLLNLAILSSFVWTRWPADGFVWVIWPVVGVIWLAAAIMTHLEAWSAVSGEGIESAEDVIGELQQEYLQGNWSRVQALAQQRLKSNSRDCEVRLMLLSMFRRLGNYESALKQLDILSGFDESQAWSFEMGRERELIDRAILEGSATERLLELSPRSDSVEQAANSAADSRSEFESQPHAERRSGRHEVSKDLRGSDLEREKANNRVGVDDFDTRNPVNPISADGSDNETGMRAA